MVVKMILRKIRERAARKNGVAGTVLMNRVGRNLHHAILRARLFHFRED